MSTFSLPSGERSLVGVEAEENRTRVGRWKKRAKNVLDRAPFKPFPVRLTVNPFDRWQRNSV